MFARLPRILIVLALAGSIGMHWALLQTVAWTGMIISYSQESALADAVAKTFDGRHPCKLCKQIAKEKRSEKKPDSNSELGKLEFRYTPATFVFRAPTAYWESSATIFGGELLSYPPATPPPRSVRA